MTVQTPNDDPNLRPASFLQDAVLLQSKDPASDIPGMARNFSRYPVVHTSTFQSYLSTGSAKVYRDYDEAVKTSLDNARYMRNDCGIMECLEARQRMVALLDWHIEPEDEKCPQQKEWAQRLTAMVERIRDFTEYRRVCQEAIWYGKSAIQNRYGWVNIRGRMCQIPTPRHKDDLGWRPIHGDKLVFRQDRLDLEEGAYSGQLGIRVGNNWQLGELVANMWKVEQCDRGMAYFLRPHERDLLTVHRHMVEDAAYEDAMGAGAIHGVGIRSRIYWEWVQKQEALGFLMDYLERSAGGIEMWSYPQGNPQAKAEVEAAARNRARGQNVMLVPIPMGDEANQYGVQVVEPGMSGIETVNNLVSLYYGHRIKRYILGQVLSSEAEATGLGSGVADLHLDTLMQIIRYDARKLEETLTHQLIDMLQMLNIPESIGCLMRFKLDTESPDIEKKLEAYSRVYEMGARIGERDVLNLIGANLPGPDDRTLSKQAEMEQQSKMQAEQQAQQGLGQPGEPDMHLAGALNQEIHRQMDEGVGQSPDSEKYRKAKKYGKGFDPAPQVTDSEPEKPHEFSSTQFNFEGDAADQMRKLAEMIPDSELADDGRETEPHVTIKYGLHADEPAGLADAVKDFGPVTIRMGQISIFPANEKQTQRGGSMYDVVKIGIEGDDIRRLNKLVSDSMEHTDTFPDYQPHATLAYVQPGEGEKYVGECSLTGTEFTFDQFVFSGKDRTHTPISLGSGEKSADRYSRGWSEGEHPRDPDNGQFVGEDDGDSSGGGDAPSDSSDDDGPDNGGDSAPKVSSRGNMEFEDAKTALLAHPDGQILFQSAVKNGEIAGKMTGDEQRQSLTKIVDLMLSKVDKKTKLAYWSVMRHFEGHKLDDQIADEDPELFDELQAEGTEKYAKKHKPAKGQKGLEWVTIGGGEEGDKKHVGGTPVQIDGSGNIHSGPDALRGKNLDKLKEGGGDKKGAGAGSEGAESEKKDGGKEVETEKPKEQRKPTLTELVEAALGRTIGDDQDDKTADERELEKLEQQRVDLNKQGATSRGKIVSKQRKRVDLDEKIQRIRKKIADVKSKSEESSTPRGETYVRGDRAEYTGNVSPEGLHEVEIMEGHRKGETAFVSSPEQQQERTKQKQAEWKDQQDQFRNLREHEQRQKAEKESTEKAKSPLTTALDSAFDSEFSLARQSAAGRKKLEIENNDANRQGALFIGKDDKPGQNYLFGNVQSSRETAGNDLEGSGGDAEQPAPAAEEKPTDGMAADSSPPQEPPQPPESPLTPGGSRRQPPAKTIPQKEPSSIKKWNYESAKAKIKAKFVPRPPKEGEELLDLRRPQNGPYEFLEFKAGDLITGWDSASESNIHYVVTSAKPGYSLKSEGYTLHKQLVTARPATDDDHSAVRPQRTSQAAETKAVIDRAMDYPRDNYSRRLAADFQGEIDRYYRTEGAVDRPDHPDDHGVTFAEAPSRAQPSSASHPPAKNKPGWQHVGGSSVFVNADGKITKGCPGLKGEHVSDLIDESEESRDERDARQAHARARGLTGKDLTDTEAKRLGSKTLQAQHQAAKAAGKASGVGAHHVLRNLPEAQERLAATGDQFEPARARARQLTGQNSVTLGMVENRGGGDSNSVANLDVIGQQLAEEFPELGWDTSDDNSAKVFELIRQGKSADRLAPHSPEVAAHAAELAKQDRMAQRQAQRQARKPTQQQSPLADPIAEAMQQAIDEWDYRSFEPREAEEAVPFSRAAQSRYSAGWNEADHPRGQAENAGEFAVKDSEKPKKPLLTKKQFKNKNPGLAGADFTQKWKSYLSENGVKHGPISGEELELAREASAIGEAKARKEKNRLNSRMDRFDTELPKIHDQLTAAGFELKKTSPSGSRYYQHPEKGHVRVSDHTANEATQQWMDRVGAVDIGSLDALDLMLQ